METYYAYLRWCVDFNERNLIDPAHDQMEWNHTLPQCIFGDQPIGQWLTLKQHAIASALQTLAFRTNCLCGWHFCLLPQVLLELSHPFYSEMCRKSAIDNKLGKDREVAIKAGEIGRETQKREGTQSKPEVNAKRSQSLKETLADPKIKKRKSEAVSGEKNPMYGLKGELSPIYGIVRSAETKKKVKEAKTGAKHWVNPLGETKMQKEKPEGVWQNGRKWKN